MNGLTLSDLQTSVQDRSAFQSLADYFSLCEAFLDFREQTQVTRIVSPSHPIYIFYQFDASYANRITRPLNSRLFIESNLIFRPAFERFMDFLTLLRKFQATAANSPTSGAYLAMNEINQVIYTMQQAIGCIGDSFSNPNQARKRIGQLFERLIKLIISEVGLTCEPRTINLPIPNYPGYTMPYELDLVFSRDRVLITSETHFIHSSEVVGSVKTTSKDRIDKIFLDKFLLTRLLGVDVPVVAIFLHDVQRAQRGNSIFGISSTFKNNHFLGYTVALNKLDGVYYVDPRPEMVENERLREQIHDFQRFLVQDLWLFAERL